MRNDWEHVLLSEVAFFQEGPGVRNAQYTMSGVKLLNVGNIQNGKIILENTARYISDEEANGRYKHFLVDAGDLIIGSSGIAVECFEKKVAFVEEQHLPLCMNTSTVRFKSLSKQKLSIEFLSYFFKAHCFKNQIARLITGSAQLNFGPSHLKQVALYLPPIDTQRKIAAVLDKAQELIDLRKAQIEKLDEFLRSVFLDMFGDPVTNPKGWEVDRLDNVAEIVSGVAKGRKLVNLQTVFVPYMRVANVQDGHLVLDEIKQIEVLPSDVTKYALLDGDLLATEGGDPDKLGRCAVWKGQIKECIHQNHIFRIRLQTNKVMPEYVSFLMGSKHGKIYFLRSSKQTTGIASINSTQLKSFPAFLPPLPLQQQFASIVEKTEQQKILMQQSLTEMENNFNSLMQRAFRGELF